MGKLRNMAVIMAAIGALTMLSAVPASAGESGRRHRGDHERHHEEEEEEEEEEDDEGCGLLGGLLSILLGGDCD
ncbi:MAG: hypothetical protein ACRDZ4_05020 [Egibacteraceae bacterium]